MNIKYIFLLLSFFTCLISFGQEHQHPKESNKPDTTKKSIPREEHAMIGKAHIIILYTAPAVRNRTIWGGLVAYDQVWVTGAHKATSFEINQSFSIGGKNIPAGKYAIFTIPGKDKWTFILNKNWEQHLADDYDSKQDLVRLDVKPILLSTIQERLNYSVVKKTDNECSIEISWEKIKIGIPVKIN